jgi:hypothetical protein
MNCKFKEKKDRTSTVALFVAVLSLLTSGFIGYKAIEHNQKSVTPYLDIGLRFISDENLKSGITLDNSGLGPAIIESIQIFWEETELKDWKELSDKLGVDHKLVIPFKLEKGNALKASKEIILYEVKFNTNPSISLENNREKIQIIINYNSLYGIESQSTLHAK